MNDSTSLDWMLSNTGYLMGLLSLVLIAGMALACLGYGSYSEKIDRRFPYFNAMLGLFGFQLFCSSRSSSEDFTYCDLKWSTVKNARTGLNGLRMHVWLKKIEVALLTNDASRARSLAVELHALCLRAESIGR